jgi:hypothetical protein
MLPIETRAYGYRFRSRLEARWAVFFQTLGLQWEYEPEGFDLGNELYLPDFRVTTGDLVYWYEIKPRDSGDCSKFERFAKLLEQDGANTEARLLHGDPSDVFLVGRPLCPRCGRPENNVDAFHSNIGFLCEPCDWNTVSGGGNPKEIGFAGSKYWPCKGWIMIEGQEYEQFIYNIEAACTAARSARFEHGEQP